MTPPILVQPSSPLGTSICYAPELEALLLSKGAVLGSDAHRIMAGAAEAGRTDLFPELLKLGATVDGSDDEGGTALIYAAAGGPEPVAFLLEHGADPNFVTRAGRTPLNQAVLAGKIATARLLLAHHANVNLASPTGHTALYFARRHNRAEMATLLQKAGGTEQ